LKKFPIVKDLWSFEYRDAEPLA